MPSTSIEQSSSTGSAQVGSDANMTHASVGGDASTALFDSAYDIQPTASTKGMLFPPSMIGDSSSVQSSDTSAQLSDSTPAPSIGQDAAFRIMSDLKKVEDARADQEAYFNPVTILGSLGAIGLGVANVIDTAGISALVAAGGTATLIYDTARGLKAGADWKAAGDDVDTTLDDLLKKQSEGSLSKDEIEHFATLMHNLPDKPISEILNDEQLEKYRRLIGGVPTQDV